MFHNTWSEYANAMRIFKHYHLNVKDSDTAAFSTSFSSYPGISFTCISSYLTYCFTLQHVATILERVFITAL